MGTNLEEDIETLLKGEAIKIQAEGESGEEESKDYKEMDYS